MDYSKEELLSNINKCANEIGNQPRYEDFKNLGYTPSKKIYTKYFGSWTNALKEAGVYDKSFEGKCANCNSTIIVKKHTHTKSTNVFCSQSCAASFNNRGRKHSFETKEKIGQKNKAAWCKLAISTCQECGIVFAHNPHNKRKYCTAKCRNTHLSKINANRVVEHGTFNEAIKIPAFSYQNITIDCDSKLEAAAVIYLVNNGYQEIERFRSIISFVGADEHIHRFNPDFIATKNGHTVVIEVKQKPEWAIRVGKYKTNLNEKRQALVDFCSKRNFKSLWLDTTNREFRKIYWKFLRDGALARYLPVVAALPKQCSNFELQGHDQS